MLSSLEKQWNIAMMENETTQPMPSSLELFFINLDDTQEDLLNQVFEPKGMIKKKFYEDLDATDRLRLQGQETQFRQSTARLRDFGQAALIGCGLNLTGFAGSISSLLMINSDVISSDVKFPFVLISNAVMVIGGLIWLKNSLSAKNENKIARHAAENILDLTVRRLDQQKQR